jgi:hypothetical protein
LGFYADLMVKLKSYEVIEDEGEFYPIVNSTFTWGDWQLVGHGEQTRANCGTFSKYRGCPRADLHTGRSLDGVDYAGKVYVYKKVFNTCSKPSCPKCFKKGWAVRQARKIELRLQEASKRFGQIEHIVASVPIKEYDLSDKALRERVVQVCMSRGIIGGVHIFHGFRYNQIRQWYFSPHYHILGFVLGGYGKCRGCKLTCFAHPDCGGWENVTRRENMKDGWIVKVAVSEKYGNVERKSVFGSAWYQLNHSSIRVVVGIPVRRFHVAVWWGVCSYHKLKFDEATKKRLKLAEKGNRACPICGSECVNMLYHGKRDIKAGKDGFFADYEEDGQVVWEEDLRDEFGFYRRGRR